MAGIETKSFDKADETRTPAKTRVDIVRVGGAEVGRLTFAWPTNSGAPGRTPRRDRVRGGFPLPAP
jgi:hypothetical protein